MIKRLLLTSAIGLTCCFGQVDRATPTGAITDANKAAVPNAFFVACDIWDYHDAYES